ncbi:MAG: transporter substrate-binding domain-containing protein [Treponema sp.]|nr:transporter substrate-binding domain-containing protein [Treponema sp.]
MFYLKNIFKYKSAFILIIICCLFAISCGVSGKDELNGITIYRNYTDIPGVTEEEIAVIEEIKNNRDYFIYGMLPNTETFLDSNGEIRGYSALLCEWLTELFGISFIPMHYSWMPLLQGLENNEVDFTGDLTANEERRKTYFMTDVMAQRSIKYFRITGSEPFSEITKTRAPRYILQEKTTITEDVLLYTDRLFETIYIDEYEEAYEILKSGRADALVTEGVQEAFFDRYDDIVISDFFPMIYSPVSFSTQNPQLKPFISVLQKALETSGIRFLNQLYDAGYQEYLRFKLFLQLTQEEKDYIKNNPVIPFAAEYDNYPVSFFSTHYNEWQGICVDVIAEIQLLTGLEFKIKNNTKAEFHELLDMLESGEVYVLSEVIRSADRESRFLWPNNSFMSERSVLISRLDHRNININRVYSERVGLSKGTAHTEFFFRWFPNHPNAVLFESQGAAFDALMNNEVDMVMNSYSTLLYLTNYQELSGFKANIMFDNSFDSTFGINKDQAVLCSIIDKALELIDTKTISEQWRHRTYDYRLKIAQARTPWLILSIALLLLVLALVAGLLDRSYRASSEMEKIVEKRTYELALQTTTLSTLFDSIPDLIFTKNLKLQFLHCNKAFLNHFNKVIDDLVGKSDEDGLEISHEDAEGFNNWDRKVINERETIAVEEHMPRYDGTNPLYETIKMPLMLEGKVIGIMGIARDITKRKEMEAAALAASQSKSTFLANMSHEIRTPMNAILGVTELLILNEELPSEIKEGLDKIYNSCDLLLGIINDILDFSKIEAGKFDILPVQYKIASMINDAVHLNMMRIESKPIIFDLKIDENIPAKLAGDELRIKQILNNLLSNAFKYTDEGKVTLSVDFEPAPDNSGIILVLGVRDSGHGMTKEQLGQMFDEYSRFNTGKKNTVEGTGLGLAITQRLVNLMNGSIHVESEPKKGSLFVIKLPQETMDAEILGKDVAENLMKFRMNYMAHRKRVQITRDPMPYGKVLVVDDVETNVYVAMGLMRLYRLQIDTAMSGFEAVDLIKNGNVYDVIFMDHMMPEMDGIETTANLRNMGYKAPIVALTANAVSGQADVFLQNGFDGFISKPIDIRQLDAILNQFVRDTKPAEVIEAARQQNVNKVNPDLNININNQIDTLLTESFVRDAKKAITWLEDQQKTGFDNEESLRKFTVIVHGIKSSLWNIGESMLADLAFKMEESGRDKNIELVNKFTPEFVNNMRVLLNKLELMQNEENEKQYSEDEDTGDLKKQFRKIQNLCADYNRKGALEKIAEINNYSKETKIALDSIKSFVLHSEFEEAEKIAAEYAASYDATSLEV